MGGASYSLLRKVAFINVHSISWSSRHCCDFDGNFESGIKSFADGKRQLKCNRADENLLSKLSWDWSNTNSRFFSSSCILQIKWRQQPGFLFFFVSYIWIVQGGLCTIKTETREKCCPQTSAEENRQNVSTRLVNQSFTRQDSSTYLSRTWRIAVRRWERIVKMSSRNAHSAL